MPSLSAAGMTPLACIQYGITSQLLVIGTAVVVESVVSDKKLQIATVVKQQHHITAAIGFPLFAVMLSNVHNLGPDGIGKDFADVGVSGFHLFRLWQPHLFP